MTYITREKVRDWAEAAIVRAIRTFAQALLGILPASFALTEVDWQWAVLTAGGAALVSILMSLGGLPEVDGGESLPSIVGKDGDHAA